SAASRPATPPPTTATSVRIEVVRSLAKRRLPYLHRLALLPPRIVAPPRHGPAPGGPRPHPGDRARARAPRLARLRAPGGAGGRSTPPVHRHLSSLGGPRPR